MKTKPESDSVVVKKVEMLHGGYSVEVRMVISKGKFRALVQSLELYIESDASMAASDLTSMVRRAAPPDVLILCSISLCIRSVQACSYVYKGEIK